MRKTLAVAAAVLVAGSVTACGGDDDNGSSASSGGGYCDIIKASQDEFADLDFTQLTADDYSALEDRFDDIATAAPADVKEQWTTLRDALDELDGILEDAGMSFDDLQQLQENPNNLPEGVDLAELQALAPKLQAWASNTDYQAAGDAITANVKAKCGIDLDDTGDTGDTPSSGS
jgi:hypothetical protein